jgi:alkylation response protein AidB-like acyl-CoA dehydrogenase
VDAIREAGLFTLKLPEVLGGAEADPVTQIEVIEALAYIDAAAGWCLMIGATAIGQPGAFTDNEAIAVIFSNGRVPTAATSTALMGVATPVDGGYVLSGRWPFASGVRHAEWMTAGAAVKDPGDAEPRKLSLVFPVTEGHIHDNWHVTGLEGSGSNDISVSDLFVPAAFTWDSSVWEPKRGGAIYRMGRPGFVANEHSGVALGIARRALDEIVRSAPTKMRGNPPTGSLADREAFRGDIASCDLRLRAARALSHDVYERAYQTARGGHVPDAAAQSEMRAVSTYVTEVAVEVATTAFRYAGGSAIHRSNILQRCLRNINAAAQHFMVSDTALENYGSSILDTPDVRPMA